MRSLKDSKCGAIVNGHRCGEPPELHMVERRHIWSPKPVSHSFIASLPSQLRPESEKDNASK